jgi:hypothetical protein
LQGWDRRSESEVVGDLVTTVRLRAQRGIEIGPDENMATCDRRQIFEARHARLFSGENEGALLRHEPELLRNQIDRTTGAFSNTDAIALREIALELIFAGRV